MNLMTELPKIAMRVLKNSHMVPKRLQAKMDVLKAVYGTAWVTRDFEDWCQAHKEDKPKYPITDYLSVIDARYGGVPEERQPKLDDPRITELASMAYEQTGALAPRRSLAVLLLDFTPEEIKGALVEYTGLLKEDEVKGAMRSFYADGGAAAIILARRKRSPNAKS